MTIAHAEGAALHPAAAASPDRLRLMWLALGTLAAFGAVGGRFDLSLAAWIAPALLLRVVRTSRLLIGLGAVWVVQILAVFVWIIELAVPPTPVAYGASVLFGTLFTLPFVADRLAGARLPATARLFLFPATRAVCEFLLASFSPLGAAYGLSAVTQREHLALLQVMSLTGPYVIGFLIGWAATAINHAWERGWSMREAARPVQAMAAALMLILLGGEWRIATAPNDAAPYVRVAGLSPSMTAAAKLSALTGFPPKPDAEMANVDAAALHEAGTAAVTELLAETRRAADAGAQMVLWSENAATIPEVDAPALFDAAAAIAREKHIYLLVADKLFLKDAPFGRDETHLIGPDGTTLWTYRKARPIPGLETYIPGGAPASVVETPFGRIANVICYDADFPAITRIDTDILFVPGGDWPQMGRVHTGMASLRAIENGYALVRQDFFGFSAAYDRTGRLIARQDTTGEGPHMMLADVPTQNSGTLYRSIGDVFAWTCLAAALGLTGLAVARSKRR